MFCVCSKSKMLRMWKGKLTRILSTGKIFIQNSDLPICLKCVHFIRPSRQNDDYELYGRCKKYGKMNLITGEIQYSLAISCRLDDDKCAYFGTGYKETPVKKGD